MVDIDWPTEFGAWLDRIEAAAHAGDQRSRAILVFTARALDQLRNLREPPSRDTELATLRWVRQARRYELCLPPAGGGPADLLVPAKCWNGGRRVVRCRQSQLGDVFYDGVAARADPLIDQWKRETGYEDKPPQEEP